MRTTRRLTLALATVVAVLLGFAAPASADTVRRDSTPNGDLTISVSSGALTDRDGDGDFNTATKGDVAGVFIAVHNNTDTAQTVHVEFLFDAPGIERDEGFATDVEVAPDEIFQGNAKSFKVKKKDPAGTYASTLTASGTESVSVTSTFTIHFPPKQ